MACAVHLRQSRMHACTFPPAPRLESCHGDSGTARSAGERDRERWGVRDLRFSMRGKRNVKVSERSFPPTTTRTGRVHVSLSPPKLRVSHTGPWAQYWDSGAQVLKERYLGSVGLSPNSRHALPGSVSGGARAGRRTRRAVRVVCSGYRSSRRISSSVRLWFKCLVNRACSYQDGTSTEQAFFEEA